MKPIWGAIFALLVCAIACTTATQSHQNSMPMVRMVLFGGGEKPSAALSKYVALAGGARSKILVIPWPSASESIPGHFGYLAAEFRANGADEVLFAPPREEFSYQEEIFWKQMEQATGLFFTGGDQNRVLDFFQENPKVRDAIHAKYHAGTVYGGTSAGTAIVAPRAFTGRGNFETIEPNAAELRPGLGLIPGVLVDQHFLVRRRFNRLVSALLSSEEAIGLGIDEGAAVLVQNGQIAEVVGQGSAMVIERQKEGAKVLLLHEGESYDLKARRRLL